MFLSPDTDDAKRLQSVTGTPSGLRMVYFNHRDIPDDLEHVLEMGAQVLFGVRT